MEAVAMGGALIGEAGCAVAKNFTRQTTRRRATRSSSPVAWTRGTRVVAAASWKPGSANAGGVAGTVGGVGGHTATTVTPAPPGGSDGHKPPRHKFGTRRGGRVVPHAVGDDGNANDDGGGYGYDRQSEVMKSVAERVKAARELAKRLANREEELASRNGQSRAPAPAPAPPLPPPPPPPPTQGQGPPPGTGAPPAPVAQQPGSFVYGEGQNLGGPDVPRPGDDQAPAPAAPDSSGEHNGDADASAAAAAALFAAEQEAVAAELEVSQFAARAVSDMDNAVMRIRQEAAKRVASAERERDRAKEESRVAVAEVKRKKAAIEEMLRQIKLDADTRVRDAEEMMTEWETLAETSRTAKLEAELAMETKIRLAEENAQREIDAARAAAAAKTAEAEQEIVNAKRDTQSSKIVQEEITRQEREKYEKLSNEVKATSEARIAEAETALEEATRRANEAQDGARLEAREILVEELARAEEALNAAEEISRIEVAAAEEAAAVLVAEKEEEARRAVEAAELRAQKAIMEMEGEMLRKVTAAKEKAASEIAEARSREEESAKTSAAIAAAKDAVARAVEEAELEVESSLLKASESEKEVEKIKEAADKRINELTADFQTQIANARSEAKRNAEAEIASIELRAEAAEAEVDLVRKEAQLTADESIQAAETFANEQIKEARRAREEAVALAKEEAKIQLETAKVDFEMKLDAAALKIKKARDDANEMKQEAREAAKWEVAAAKAEAEANAAAARETVAKAERAAAEKQRDAAVDALTDAELSTIGALKDLDSERRKAVEQVANEKVAVANAVSEANEVSVAQVEQVRQELRNFQVQSATAVASAETHAKNLQAELDKTLAEMASKEAHAEAALQTAVKEKEDAEQRADEAQRVSNDLQNNDPMELAIEFEKRVASATAELEKVLKQQRERGDAAENRVGQLEHSLGSVRSELDTALAELELSSSAELREAKGDQRVLNEIAKLQVALEQKNAEIFALRNGQRENGQSIVEMMSQEPQMSQEPEQPLEVLPEHAPGASAEHILAAQAASGAPGRARAPTNAGPPVQPSDKTTEELELEDLLNEVMALKGEVGETARPGGQTESAIDSMKTMETVYAEAYHSALASRKATRRKEAEGFATTQVVVVSSSVKEVYHWLGGGPRNGDSAIIYNRKNPNGLGESGQLFMHLGYNGWQGEPRQVGMRPLQHDHPSRAELWLNDQGGDWWIAEPVFVPPPARVLDFVFSDGEGEYDNSGGKDYHSPVGADDGSPPVEIDHVKERELALEREFGHLDAQFAEKAGRAAERKFVSRRGFDKKKKESFATAKVVVFPENPVAGQTIEIFYRGGAMDLDPKAPLKNAPDVFVQGGWNRWNHPLNFGPTRMVPAQTPPGGDDAQNALVAVVQIPPDAHVCDFVFTDDARLMAGRYDSRDGLDYHKSINGAVGDNKPVLRVVHVAVEMAPIAKVGGMGDVVTALARAVIEMGHSVEVILPKYDVMDLDQIDNLQKVDSFEASRGGCAVWKGVVADVPVTFLQPDTGHFDVGCIYGRNDDHVRFEYFSDCALLYLTHANDVPDVIHVHDWSTSHICFARKNRLPPGAATVLTIHNLQFGDDLIGRAMKQCTFATTVSPTYATEISNHKAISGDSKKMVGIRNGIDVELWDPLTDTFVPLNYDAETFKRGKAAARSELATRLGMEFDESKPLIGVVARLTHQKGIHLIKHACWRSLEKGGQFVLLGSSPDGNVQNDFNKMAYDVGGRFPGQSGFVFAYDEPLSHLVYAASDMLLVPSMFEPCGLTQMIAMRYGTVPVVRRTGGLKDTVFDVDEDTQRAIDAGLNVNGFSFDGSNDHDINYALDRALMTYDSERHKWDEMVGNIMKQDWGWNDPAKTYVEHYWKAAKTMKDAYFKGKDWETEGKR